MHFRILGLDPAPFIPLFGQGEAQLAARGAERFVADASPGYPDRIELRDAEPGETVLLLNHTHLDEDTPYRASHAIFVRERARRRYDRIDEVPESMRRRLLSLRAYDERHRIVAADIVDGSGVEGLIERLLDDVRVRYLHAHYAKRGCYAARIERAD